MYSTQSSAHLFHTVQSSCHVVLFNITCIIMGVNRIFKVQSRLLGYINIVIVMTYTLMNCEIAYKNLNSILF